VRIAPSRKEWRRWSLPSKASYVGVVLAIIAILPFIGTPIIKTLKRETPAFSVQIRALHCFIPDGHQGTTGVAALVNVENKGAPGVLSGWKLRAQMPNGKRAEATTLHFGKGGEIKLIWEGGRQSTVLRGDDSLEEKTANVQILNGGSVLGWLHFRFENAPKYEFLHEDTALTLVVADQLGNHYEMTDRISEIAKR